MMNGAPLGPGFQAILLEPGKNHELQYVDSSSAPLPSPSVSCMMPTRGDIFPARYSIDCFRRQRHPNRELVVVCRSPNSEVEDYLAELADPLIKFAVTAEAATVGELRNFALDMCEGDFVCIWDDDDLSHPERLATQIRAVQELGAEACFLLREMLWWPALNRLAVSGKRVWENTMLAARASLPRYPSLDRREDTALVKQLTASSKVVVVDKPECYLRIYHGGNIWDADHFDRFFSKATVVVSEDGYARELAGLALSLPVSEYLDHFKLERMSTA